MPTYLLGIDQGTSGSRALIMDETGQVRGYGYCPLPRLYPQPGWVEQEPDTLAAGVNTAIAEALSRANCQPIDIVACGIACQRNTDFIWDAQTRRPLANAITWQDLRTVALISELEGWPLADQRRRRLGYFPGPYSSAMHLAWRMRHDPVLAQALRTETARIGFSAAWLLAALGQPAAHVMDYSLVQSTGLYDFRAGHYWQEWLEQLQVPLHPLPQPVPTTYNFGTLRLTATDGTMAEVPVTAMVGNEQAALFGHDCRHAGDAECTHGTASFVDVVVGNYAPEQDKLNVYHAWTLPTGDRGRETGDQQFVMPSPELPSTDLPISQSPTPNLPPSHTFCLEADTTVSGAAIRWMREQARLFDRDDEAGPLAASVPDSAGVVFVPAFTGLNVPYNDQSARGTIIGLTLGTNRAHIVRAFFESLGYQVRAILETIAVETGVRIEQLHLGGGISASDEACQIQADLIGLPLVRPAFAETAARGAALLAGLGAGVWPNIEALPPLPGEFTTFEPALSAEQRDEGYARWQAAVERAKAWT